MFLHLVTLEEHTSGGLFVLGGHSIELGVWVQAHPVHHPPPPSE